MPPSWVPLAPGDEQGLLTPSVPGGCGRLAQHKGSFAAQRAPPCVINGGDTYCEKSQINHHPNVAFQRDRHLFIYLSTDRLNIILHLYLYLYRVADILSVYLGADLNSY